jgi:hypothetical protein
VVILLVCFSILSNTILQMLFTFVQQIDIQKKNAVLPLKVTYSTYAEGTVDQVGADYIGLKVLGGLVAVIHNDELQRKFKYSREVRFEPFWQRC